MRRKLITSAALAAAVVAALAGLAAADGGEGEEGAAPQTQSPGDETAYLGLPLDEAAALAEADDRPWRISRRDDTDHALTADLRPGRVTFEIDDGVVTAAAIEEPSIDPPGGGTVPEDPARSKLIADALYRLVTTDSSFEGPNPFLDIRVATGVGTNGETLQPLDLELIADRLSEVGPVTFVDDPDALIADLFDAPPGGVVVLEVERLELLDDRAEIELRLWCGSLCGVFLTYGAEPTEAGVWEITGTVGPIAMS